MLGTPEESGDSRTTEVLVYGGTAGGVAAAIAAARAGCDVLLVESGAHIGGMMASGLGAIDLLRFNAVGGIFGEFLDKVRHFYDGTYGESSEQYRLTWGGVFMEPHVAEIILEQMVEAESLVRVLKRTPLVGALLEEQRLLGAGRAAVTTMRAWPVIFSSTGASTVKRFFPRARASPAAMCRPIAFARP